MNHLPRKLTTKMITTLVSKIKVSIKTVISTKPSNAFLLFITGFFFSQFMLVNILYTKNPLGGWVTSVGTFTTPFLLFASLLALSACLLALWRNVAGKQNSKESRLTNKSVVRTRNNYSPIDYPKGSATAVVSGYAIA